MSCGIGRRCSLDLALLWLWCRLAATAPIRMLAWELPYATGSALKGKKKKKKNWDLKFTPKFATQASSPFAHVFIIKRGNFIKASLHLCLWPQQQLILKHRKDLAPDDLECREAKLGTPQTSHWHAFYFGLKTIKAQEEILTFPTTPWRM